MLLLHFAMLEIFHKYFMNDKCSQNLPGESEGRGCPRSHIPHTSFSLEYSLCQYHSTVMTYISRKLNVFSCAAINLPRGVVPSHNLLPQPWGWDHVWANVRTFCAWRSCESSDLLSHQAAIAISFLLKCLSYLNIMLPPTPPVEICPEVKTWSGLISWKGLHTQKD